jgi:hypothetical protein
LVFEVVELSSFHQTRSSMTGLITTPNKLGLAISQSMFKSPTGAVFSRGIYPPVRWSFFGTHQYEESKTPAGIKTSRCFF